MNFSLTCTAHPPSRYSNSKNYQLAKEIHIIQLGLTSIAFSGAIQSMEQPTSHIESDVVTDDSAPPKAKTDVYTLKQLHIQ